MTDWREYILDRAMPEPNTGCWIWTGAYSHGYGTMSRRSPIRRAHRASYLLFVGPLASGLVIDHKCNSTWCVNPDHLQQITQRDNVLRGDGPIAANHRKVACVHGHEFTIVNTWMDKLGKRHCKTCQLVNKRRWTRENRSAYNARARAYRAANPERVREYDRARRAKKVAA